MNKLSSILRAHINEKERHILAQKNGRDPKVKGSELARLLGEKNSGGEDTVLADISMEDARLLKLLGGSGRVDPDTKKPHFEEGDGGDGGGWGASFDSGMADAYSSTNTGSIGEGFTQGLGAPGGEDGVDSLGGGSWQSAAQDAWNSVVDSGRAEQATYNQSAADALQNDSPGRGYTGNETWQDQQDQQNAMANQQGLDMGYTQADLDAISNSFNQSIGQGGAGGLEQGLGTLGDNVGDAAVSTIDDDGSGKGRSDSAFGKGGELEGFGTAMQGWASDMNMGTAYDSASSKKGNEMLTNFLGYDPSKTELGDVGNAMGFNQGGARSGPSANGPGYTNHGNASWMGGMVQGSRNDAAPAFVDENSTSYGQGANFNAPGANAWGFTQDQAAKAGNEYSSMGFHGQLTGDGEDGVPDGKEATPWSYTGLDNQSHTNWGSIGSDAVSAFGSPLVGGIAAATGLSVPWSVLNSGLQATKGNYQLGANTLAGIIGGPQAAAGVNALGSLINGTPGNTIAGLGAGYLNTVAPGAGSLLSATGLAGRAANSINDTYQMAMNDAMNADSSDGLSSEGNGTIGTGDYTPDPIIDEGGPAEGGGDPGGPSAPAASGGGGGRGGGGGYSEFSDYGQINDPFLISKKKSRYRRPNSLMALLESDNAG